MEYGGTAVVTSSTLLEVPKVLIMLKSPFQNYNMIMKNFDYVARNDGARFSNFICCCVVCEFPLGINTFFIFTFFFNS